MLAKVDCTLDSAKDLCQEYGVRGYPTLKFFKKGSVMDYTGPRETDGIIAWIEKKTGPAVFDAKTDADLATFLTTNNKANVVVGYFAAAGSEEQVAFAAAAEDPDMEEFKFAQRLGGSKDGVVELRLPGADALPVRARWNCFMFFFLFFSPLSFLAAVQGRFGDAGQVGV